VAAFQPTDHEIGTASAILFAASENNWAPIRHDDELHDRASYRYYWSVLQRAQATGATLPRHVAERFFT
jgi:citrate lyase subunit beta/citryl-CoA lyase